jgi:transcriptional regulator with AAA-type ATPase domain
MGFANETERGFARAVARLLYGNPFLPERLEVERAALGPAFDPGGTLWHVREEPAASPNVQRIGERVAALVERLGAPRGDARRGSPEDRELAEALALYRLYDRYQVEFYRLATDGAGGGRVGFARRFADEVGRLLGGPDAGGPDPAEIAHLFACFFQVRRAFHHIYANILGHSGPARRLRAAVWQSIFTHDARRYRRTLYARMGDLTTLIQGPSGTGKELVARAIGLSRYIPFDPGKEAFAQDPAAAFFPLNLAALSPTLIEAELFGHRRGAFTGAVQDRPGWFEVCPPLGTVFLDEIGEVEPGIQVKLLRVLQTRTFQRLGETQDRRFQGKLIAATNRDLATEIEAGRFREDFYYRLCSDVIVTPTLAEQLLDAPGELRGLLGAIARRVAGEAEAEPLAHEAERWIRTALGPDYPWPGNVRELEQCLRNILVRGTYRPRRPRAAATTRSELAQAVLAGTLSADDLLRRYCTLVYAQTGSYLETARRLGLDRRTARAKVDAAWLGELRAETGRAPAARTRRGRR